MKSDDSIKRGCLLQVPYREKDEAKKLGARWDPDIKSWFVPLGTDIAPFRKWFLAEEEQTSPGASRDSRRK